MTPYFVYQRYETPWKHAQKYLASINQNVVKTASDGKHASSLHIICSSLKWPKLFNIKAKLMQIGKFHYMFWFV